MPYTFLTGTRLRVAGKILLAVGFAVATILLMIWLAGSLYSKTEPRAHPAAPRHVDGAALAPVEVVEIPRTETAVGTIRAVRQTSVGAKLLAKVTAVHVKAGQAVRRDEVLAQLEDDELKARFNQAQARVRSAEASARFATPPCGPFGVRAVASVSASPLSVIVIWPRYAPLGRR